MEHYHLRRKEKEIKDQAVLDALLLEQRYVTLAMCKDNAPYLVTLSYGYDAAKRCFYFHCARDGKKMDYLQANPNVWGEVIADLGYKDGACDHAFRSVHFKGTVAFIEDIEEKRAALDIMVDQLESIPDAVKQAQFTPARIKGVTVGRIDIEEMTGKENL